MPQIGRKIRIFQPGLIKRIKIIVINSNYKRGHGRYSNTAPSRVSFPPSPPLPFFRRVQELTQYFLFSKRNSSSEWRQSKWPPRVQAVAKVQVLRELLPKNSASMSSYSFWENIFYLFYIAFYTNTISFRFRRNGSSSSGTLSGLTKSPSTSSSFLHFATGTVCVKWN